MPKRIKVPEDIMETIKRRLRELRRKMGKGGNRKFAEILGISPSLISQWLAEEKESKTEDPSDLENNVNDSMTQRKGLTLGDLLLISSKVGIPVDLFFYETDADWHKRALEDSRLSDEENMYLFERLMEIRDLMILGMIAKKVKSKVENRCDPDIPDRKRACC